MISTDHLTIIFAVVCGKEGTQTTREIGMSIRTGLFCSKTNRYEYTNKFLLLRDQLVWVHCSVDRVIKSNWFNGFCWLGLLALIKIVGKKPTAGSRIWNTDMKKKTDTNKYISSKTLISLKKCNKILLTGNPEDIYKITFYTNDYRYIKIELMQPLNQQNKLLFFKASKSWYQENKGLNLTYDYNRVDALKILESCEFNVGKPDQETIKFVLEVLS